jgi:hypothetical protein
LLETYRALFAERDNKYAWRCEIWACVGTEAIAGEAI